MVTDTDLKYLVWIAVNEFINAGWTTGPFKDCQIQGEYIIVYLGDKEIKLFIDEVAMHSHSAKDFIGYLKKEIGK